MNANNKQRKNVLICPLDWGLGHTSRIIPIIKKIQKKGHKIFISCSKTQQHFFINEISNYTWIPTASPQIKYNYKRLKLKDLFKLIPIIFKGIKKDKIKIEQWIKKYNIDLIISDNRYGCYSSKVYSVIITHQIKVKLPQIIKWAELIIHKKIKKLLNRFDRCWIPDVAETPNFAGDLSHKFLINGKFAFIGLLSRFDLHNKMNDDNVYSNEVLGIVSGPEPQRTKFAQILLTQMIKLNKPCILVLGNFSTQQTKIKEKNVTIYSYMNTQELYKAIQSSKYIIARSGYSTIMDLICLKRSAILVPTPGQTEQEYLAKYYQSRKMFVIANQNTLNIKDAIAHLSVYSLKYNYNTKENLEIELERVLN